MPPPLQYVVKEDYHPTPPQDSLLLSLNRGDVVEILDNNIDGKWVIRARTKNGGVAHGWFPSKFLERMDGGGEEEEEVDGKKGWVQITAGMWGGREGGRERMRAH